jgi:glyoxylase-like metal-dependent hydrolase (beta-lactamase superfamily II)
MKILKVVSEFLETNCYIITNNEKAIVIDPCVDYNVLVKKYNLSIDAVLLTHGHIDHFYKIKSFLNKGITFYLHKETIIKLNDAYKNCSIFIGDKTTVDLTNEKVIKIHDSFVFTINDLTIKVIATPGHTNDSVSFIIENYLFSGDSLFRESIGRVDLPTSNHLMMNRTIKNFKIMKINYKIYPGHGEETDLDYEKINNNYFR